ncbi:hypothetical protein Tco_0189766 [Tanacetum coccineum]
MQSKEGKVDLSKALDAVLVVTECSGTKSDKQVTSSSSGNYITHVVYADIRPVNDQVPFAEVQLTAQYNVLANEQQHSMQYEPIYDTHLLEKVDSNTTPDSTNMCHRGGEIDQNAEKCQVSCPLLDPSFDNMTTEFSNQSLEFENIYLKKTVTYKDIYDSIKKTRVQTKDYNDSLIAQVNSKTVENVDLKAQIQEKIFTNAALKKELRKLKENSRDTKLPKSSILGKPVLQPLRNQSVVRQPNAFQSERLIFSKPRFASQVDVKNDLTKPVTPHYLPKVPTGKIFTSSTTKVDCEPPNDSNVDITNPYECDQTLNVNAGGEANLKVKSYQGVRYRCSFSRSSQNQRDLSRNIPLDRIEVHSNILRVLCIILVILPEHQSDTKVFTVMMEILPEPTSNKLCDSYKDGHEDLPTTYKGLMEKTYTWIEAKEVATNGAPNTHREGFNMFNKGSYWDNNKGRKKDRDRFFVYKGFN